MTLAQLQRHHCRLREPRRGLGVIGLLGVARRLGLAAIAFRRPCGIVLVMFGVIGAPVVVLALLGRPLMAVGVQSGASRPPVRRGDGLALIAL